MNHNLSNDQINDVTSHHEAGHVSVMVMRKIPILRFERKADGSAQVVPDRSSTANGIEGLYDRFLATRASRFSQKLSHFNSPLTEQRSFDDDDNELDRQAKGLFDAFKFVWVNDKPTIEKLKDELLAVADDELSVAYQDAHYKSFVQGVAAALTVSTSIAGAEIKRLVEEYNGRENLDTETSKNKLD